MAMPLPEHFPEEARLVSFVTSRRGSRYIQVDCKENLVQEYCLAINMTERDLSKRHLPSRPSRLVVPRGRVERLTRAVRQGFDPGLVGDAVREARTSRRPSLTLASLASAVGCSVALLSKVENGVVVPSLPMLSAIAYALAVPVGSLINGSSVNAPAGRLEAQVQQVHASRLLGWRPDLGPLVDAERVGIVGVELRARVLALLAAFDPDAVSGGSRIADAIALVTPGTIGANPVSRAPDVRAEVLMTAGEMAFARSDVAEATTLWGRGLACATGPGMWQTMVRARLSLNLARINEGSGTSIAALSLARESLELVSDPAMIARREANLDGDGPATGTVLALAIVATARGLLAEVVGRIAVSSVKRDARSDHVVRPDVSHSRHLR